MYVKIKIDNVVLTRSDSLALEGRKSNQNVVLGRIFELRYGRLPDSDSHLSQTWTQCFNADLCKTRRQISKLII